MNNNIDIEANKQNLYNNVNIAVSSTNDINLQLFILEKLVLLFPEDHELYYKIAKIYKGASKDKELLWYKLCFGVNPDYTDNFCDMCDLLLEMGYSNHILTLDKNGLFEKFMKEPRFLTVYVRCNLINLKYENALKHLLDLIKLNSTKKCITEYDKNEKWRNYHDAGYLLCAKCDIEKSISFSQKAAELAVKFKLDLQKQLLSFQNVLCFSDYLHLDHETLFKKYLNMNNVIPDRNTFSFANRKRNDKIRVGYVSADFVLHSVSNFILPVLRNHDKNLFDIHLFSNAGNVFEGYTKVGATIHNIQGVTDEEVSKLIYKLNIDILIDLGGHTVNNRMRLFTFNSCPVQMTYLGFPNTTGLKSIKYRITDSIADSPLTKQRYSEELIRLPRCFLLYDPIHPFRYQPKKTEKTIVLGAINKENKSNDELLSVWGTILEKCPNTVIMLKLESFDNTEERTNFYISKLHTTKDRIIVLNKLGNEEYEKIFNRVDLMLDPFPYSGTTTTCNSLFNSIPVVTLYHPDYHVTNVTSSLLINSGFPELVANSKEEYVSIIVDLVNHPDRIEEYKKTIRPRFLELMDPKPFMRSYEAELTHVYEKFMDPIKNDPIKNDPIKNDPIKNDPIKNDPIKNDPIKNDPIKNASDTITVTFDTDLENTVESEKENEKPIHEGKVYICGCVKNCAPYLDDVFSNIDKVKSLFGGYKIIVSVDDSDDNTLEMLRKKQAAYDITIIDVPENRYIKDFTMRTKRISNARNEILQYIYNENNDEFPYFIMMDMDNVCSGPMDIDVLRKSIEKNNEWDSLSFNRTNYFDIWALSIEPFVFSCWHFPGGFANVELMKQYVMTKLRCMRKDHLLECISAFNGFAIYKKEKFVDCIYDWQLQNNYEKFSKEMINRNEKEMGVAITLDKAYHQVIHPVTDCEHRYFHMSAIEKNDAKIRISPQFLFLN